MISILEGKPELLNDTSITILANGVGWEVNILNPQKFLNQESVRLYIRTVFKEADVSLWGFEVKEELEIFQLLLSVSGVGPKTAQLILALNGVKQTILAIRHGNTDLLKVKGVGKKTAEKIILLLKDKVEKRYSHLSEDADEGISQFAGFTENFEDARNALLGLGYDQASIDRVLKEISRENPDEEVDKIIKLALSKI